MIKEPLFSLTRKDFRIDYYKGTGKGGQKRNKTENCCRVTHLSSGAVGRGEEGRSKVHNQKVAFKRMAQTAEFQSWLRFKITQVTGRHAEIEAYIQSTTMPEFIKVEVFSKEEGKWVDYPHEEAEGE